MNRPTPFGALLTSAALICSTSLMATLVAPTAASASYGDITTRSDEDISTVHAMEPLGQAMWFTSFGNDRIGRLDLTGANNLTTWPLAALDGPTGLTATSDGNLWVASYGTDRLVHLDPASNPANAPAAQTYLDIQDEVDKPLDVTMGPDGHVWFTSSGNGRIGELDPANGNITTYRLPAMEGPVAIDAGADGNLWFTDNTADRIGRITTAGAITLFSHPDVTGPTDLVAGADGRLWFISDGDTVGAIRPSDGTIVVHHDPLGRLDVPSRITAGPEGSVWVSNHAGVTRVTPRGAMATFPFPPQLPLRGIGAGADGHVWAGTASSESVHRIDAGVYLLFNGPSDVPAGSPIRRPYVWARNKGILGPAALFNGQNRILRRGAVAMVWGLMESPTGFPANGFVDVPGGATYGPALDWARAAGVVTAAGNRFRPNAALTRLQAANLLWRAAGSPAGNPSHGFSDVGNGNQAVRWARSALVLSGFANGTFRPNRPVTRTLLLTSIYHLALNPAAWSRPAPSTVLFPSLLG